jgi:hypothetical protein
VRQRAAEEQFGKMAPALEVSTEHRFVAGLLQAETIAPVDIRRLQNVYRDEIPFTRLSVCLHVCNKLFSLYTALKPSKKTAEKCANQTFTEQHGPISNKAQVVTTTAVKNSNSECPNLFYLEKKTITPTSGSSLTN